MNQKQIGEFIAQLRKEQNMTQIELGEKLGVTNKTVSRWENGNYMPDISIMQELCETLNISINELVSGKNLNESEFKSQADTNLILSMTQIKKIKKEKTFIDFFGGSGTGIIVSALTSPDSIRRSIIIVIGLIMILISWYIKANYDKQIIGHLEKQVK